MKYLVFVLTFFLSLNAEAACQVNAASFAPTTDYLHLLLSQENSCPIDVREFQKILDKNNLTTIPSMVANRGIHNPTLGSFSFFESVTGTLDNHTIQSGEFFFGHFTDKQNNKIVLDQTPENGKLMVELIVWDFGKKVFNFYEMIGNGSEGVWFYRGNSLDILKDVQFLHLTPPAGKPKFGNTLRCSGCHTSGGPIMKELEFPHNDWWSTKRPLSFGDAFLKAEVAAKVDILQDSKDFAASIKQGMNQLEASPSYQQAKKALSLPEQLRPLFCEVEINLVSDLIPLNSAASRHVQIPTTFFVNPLLTEGFMSIAKSDYVAFLSSFKMHFPETNDRDADHAWLTPVKGHSDILAINTLIESHVIDRKFALSVLSIDKENPLVSRERCSLLKLVPEKLSMDWMQSFKSNLKQSGLLQASALLQTFEKETEESLVKNAENYLNSVSKEFNSLEGTKKYFLKLIETRNSVFQSEISKNPRGQILEPGFRVIFPKPLAGM